MMVSLEQSSSDINTSLNEFRNRPKELLKLHAPEKRARVLLSSVENVMNAMASVQKSIVDLSKILNNNMTE